MQENGTFEIPRAWHGFTVSAGPAEARDASAVSTEAPHVVVVGVPFEGGAGAGGGASGGPGRVRDLSRRAKRISRRGHDFSHLRLLDAGDVATERFDLAATVQHLRRAYEGIFRSTSAPVLTFGGDHSITYPIVAAAAAAHGKRLGLLWFDAHPDVLDTYLGSPVSHGSPLRRILDAGAVAPEDVLLVGTRAYDPGEPAYLAQVGVTELRAADFADDRAGAMQRYRQEVVALAERVDQLYVSIDIDVLDASLVPGTGTPVAGGIDTLTLLTLLEQIPEPVLAYDVVEFAPVHDVGGMTGHAVMAITTTLLARTAHVGAAQSASQALR